MKEPKHPELDYRLAELVFQKDMFLPYQIEDLEPYPDQPNWWTHKEFDYVAVHIPAYTESYEDLAVLLNFLSGDHVYDKGYIPREKRLMKLKVARNYKLDTVRVSINGSRNAFLKGVSETHAIVLALIRHLESP